jgi:hypothetical protein
MLKYHLFYTEMLPSQITPPLLRMTVELPHVNAPLLLPRDPLSQPSPAPSHLSVNRGLRASERSGYNTGTVVKYGVGGRGLVFKTTERVTGDA